MGYIWKWQVLTEKARFLRVHFFSSMSEYKQRILVLQPTFHNHTKQKVDTFAAPKVFFSDLGYMMPLPQGQPSLT